MEADHFVVWKAGLKVLDDLVVIDEAMAQVLLQHSDARLKIAHNGNFVHVQNVISEDAIGAGMGKRWIFEPPVRSAGNKALESA